MIAGNRGHILITSSLTAFGTVSSVVDYSASKAAVTSIIEGLQTEMKHKYGNPAVKISGLLPGTLATRMFEGIDESANSFILPVLEPSTAADRMIEILSKGDS